MLKLDEDAMQDLETQYPGICEQVMRFENARLPVCTRCGSADIAEVNVGIVGRTMAIASATSKFTLIPNGPKSGNYWCRSCNKFFD